MEYDGLIYHYCSTESFVDIIKSKELWLSSVYDTNDKTEFRILRDKYLHAIDSKLDATAYSYFKGKIKEKLNEPEICPYIFCFSKGNDLLSQWRGYGNRGHGVALGFDPNLFGIKKWNLDETLTADNCIGIANVNYDKIGILDGADELISGLIEHKSVFEGMNTENNKSDIDQLIIKISLLILRLSAIYKHKAFSEEDEFRIVYFPYNYKNELETVLAQFAQAPHANIHLSYRCFRGRVVKYYSYKFPLESLKIIRTGPEYQKGTISVMREYLTSLGLPHVIIEESTCPYRN